MSTIFKTLVLLFLLCATQQAMAQNFITQWTLATAGSGAIQLTFGTATSGVVNYTWQEISPGSATGSGSGAARHSPSPVYLSELTFVYKLHLPISNASISIVEYDNSTVVFDGTSTNGKDLLRTYFYKIEFNSALESITGFLSLKR